MKIARILIAGTVAFTILNSAALTQALAQQAQTGMVTGINRLNGTIAIKQTQSGTVGANTGGASEEFKVQSGVSLEDMHAGDAVSFSATGTSGTRTVTKLQRQ